MIVLQLRSQVVEQLNLQYKTHGFHSSMTPREVVRCAENAMRSSIDLIDYELNAYFIERYGIRVQYCAVDPFTQEEYLILEELLAIIEKLAASFHEPSVAVNKQLQILKDFVVARTTRLSITEKYHKYLLRFKSINIKEAIIFETLSKCQVFYTILRERKKSGKEYFMDPLILAYEQIKQKLQIVHSFHETVLPKKQLRYFEKKNTDKRMKNTLFEAVTQKRYKEVKELIAKGASIEEPGIAERTKREMNCSHRACQLGDLQLCLILDSYKVNWEPRDKEGITPLHFAVQSGSLSVVQFLIEEAKVSLEPKDIQERTPFYFACTEGDLAVIKYLYAKGVDINNKSKLGRSALSKACYLGLVEVVTFLMKCPGIILNSADGKGRTALHNSVFGPKGGREGHKFGTNEKDSPECTQLLLENGFDVDIQDIQYNTPLHVSMSSDGIDSIRILLAYNGSLTKLNEYDETPLMTGAKFGHLESVIVLKEEYGASLTLKDKFNKNLMLLCAKFRQDDGKSVNRVFYYSTDQLLRMASEHIPLVPAEKAINNWQQEIDHTFSELLKERARVDTEFKYFCKKCMELGLSVYNLSLEQIKALLDMIKNSEDEDEMRLVRYFLCERPFSNQLDLTQTDFQDFIKWVISENSTKLLDFLGSNEKALRHYLHVASQSATLFEEIAKAAFDMIHVIKEKVLTYCLLKLDINWIEYLDERYDNILHLLVRHKKVGSLIQVLKTLSGTKMDFISNRYVLEVTKESERWKDAKREGESPLELLLRNLLLHKNREGFDPYHLALLIKDASAAKLLEEKMNVQQAVGKSQFQVREYSLRLEDDANSLQIFNRGYELESELQALLVLLGESKSKTDLSSHLPLLQQDSKLINNSEDIDSFSSSWRNISERKLIEISQVAQVERLAELSESSVLGIDIEYFYSDGVTLMSIMQLSTLTQDYIIDFLTSAHSHESSAVFIQAVRKALVPIASSSSIVKIMHGSDNDLCVIKSILNLSFLNFIDTARIDVDIRKQQNIRGLATLVHDYLHEHMSKDYQVSEWRIRPIPASMLDYARRDSMVLPFLARKLLACVESERLGEVIANGCRQARRNRKASQPLIRSIQSL